MDGFFLIDKDKGWTSFDVVKKIRGLIGVKKVGHSGTLDPLATGLLLVAVGQGTKLLEYLIACNKEYEVLAHFGAVSDTYDAEGDIINGQNVKKISKEDIFEMIKEKFLGEIDQVPPKYSALKINGRRACDLVREGKKVSLNSRKIMINKFEQIGDNWPLLSFRVQCGSGTYIRSLIHDLGNELGVGAYVQELKRTVLGGFSLGASVKLEVLSREFDQGWPVKRGELGKKIDHSLSMETVARMFENIDLTSRELEALGNGRVLFGRSFESDGPVMGFCEGRFVGVLEKFNDNIGIKFAKMIV